MIVSLLLAGLLTGNEMGTLLAVHPAIRTLPVREQVTMEQALTRRYLVIMPVLMVGTIVSAFLAGFGATGPSRPMLLAAGTLYCLMLGITLVGNMTLNVATLRTVPTEATLSSWRSIRRRWDLLHIGRVGLDLSGFVLVAIAATR